MATMISAACIKTGRTAKVTLCVIAAVLLAGVSRADDITTATGKRYEKVHVTEITPATIAFRHSAGAARLWFTELGPDAQKKYGYDEAKARSWLAEQARAEQARRDEEEKQKRLHEQQGRSARAAIQSIVDYQRAGGHVEVDPRNGEIYDPDVRAARSEAILKWILENRASRAASHPGSPSGTP